jgi:hypothetical protein
MILRGNSSYFLNPSKPKLVCIIFKNPVITSKKIQHVSITKTNWSVLFKKIITVYSEDHMKLINTCSVSNVELLIVKAGGIYSYYRVLKDQTALTN